MKETTKILHSIQVNKLTEAISRPIYQAFKFAKIKA